MLDDDIQQELLRDTVDLERALSIAVNMEMEHQNQQLISSNKSNANSNAVITIQSFTRFRGANDHINQSGRNSFNRGAIGFQHIVRFALLWVRNVIIVVCSFILQKYVGKN